MFTKLIKIAKHYKTNQTIIVQTTSNHRANQELANSLNNFDLLSLIQQRTIHRSQLATKNSIFQMTNKIEANNRILLDYASEGHMSSYIGLTWAGQVLRQLNKNVVDLQTYKASLQKYYGYMLQSKCSSSRFCKAFCYLQDLDLKKMIKLNQIKLLKKYHAQNKLNANAFQDIVKSELFNITDLPFISEIMYQVYFPILGKLQHLHQLHKALIYLKRFSKIPFFLPQKLHDLLQQKQLQVQNMNFSQFCETVNVIYLLLFQFPKTLEDTNLKESFQKLFNVLLKRYIKKNYQNKTDISAFEKVMIITEREKLKLPRLILQRSLEIQYQEKKLQQKIPLFQNKEQLLFQCLNKQLKQSRQLSLNNFRSLKDKTELQFQIKSNRIIMMIGSNPMPTSNIHATLSYLKNPGTKLFYKLNRCLPNLLLSTQIVLNNIRNNVSTFSNEDIQIFDYLNKIALTIDKSIDEDLEEFSDQVMSDTNSQNFLSFYYSQDFQSILWRKNDIHRLAKMQLNYSITNTNFLKFLKNDPRFFIKLMKWNKYDYVLQSTKNYETHDTKIVRNKFGEGLGFTIQPKDQTKLRKTYLIESEVTKNHIFSTSNLMSSSQPKSKYFRGKPNFLVRYLKDLQKSGQQ